MFWQNLLKTVLVTAVGAAIPVVTEHVGQSLGMAPNTSSHIVSPATGGGLAGLVGLLTTNPWKRGGA